MAPKLINEQFLNRYINYISHILDAAFELEFIESSLIGADLMEEIFKTGKLTINHDQIYNSHEELWWTHSPINYYAKEREHDHVDEDEQRIINRLLKMKAYTYDL